MKERKKKRGGGKSREERKKRVKSFNLIVFGKFEIKQELKVKGQV